MDRVMIGHIEQDENREQHSSMCFVVGSVSSLWPGQEPLSNHHDKMAMAMGSGMDMIAEASFRHLDVPTGVSTRLLGALIARKVTQGHMYVYMPMLPNKYVID